MDLPIFVAIRDEEDPRQPRNQQAKKGNPQGGRVDKAKEARKKKGQGCPDIGGYPKHFDTVHRLTYVLLHYHLQVHNLACNSDEYAHSDLTVRFYHKYRFLNECILLGDRH